MSENERKTLDVRLMGGFECRCNGVNLSFIGKPGAKMVQFFIYLLYFAPTAQLRTNLLEALYQDSNSDPGNSLKTMLFRLRKAMSQDLGISEDQCILLENGMFRFSDLIHVESDVRHFRELDEAQKTAATREDKVRILNEMLALYHGELLPMLSTENWVIYENAYLTDCFMRAVTRLGNYYTEQSDYGNAERVYHLGLSFFPYEEGWIIGYLDSLSASGEGAKALREYEDMTKAMFDEFGVYPSEKLIEAMKRISDKVANTVLTVDNVERTLKEDNVIGAYYCNYPTFVDSYRILRRIMMRDGITSSLVMINLVDRKGELLERQGDIAAAINVMRRVLTKYLRKNDIFTRYGRSQMLILLWGTPAENVSIVTERIHSSMVKEFENTPVQFDYVVLEEGETEQSIDLDAIVSSKKWPARKKRSSKD